MANNAHHHMHERPALLLTRPQSSAESFVSQLDPAVMVGVTVVISPLLEIVPTHAAIAWRGYRGVIFTSAHAPACVAHATRLPAYCVGARTAEAAQQRGWDVRLVAQTAEDLLTQVEQVDGPLLHIAGAHRRGEIADRLSARGMRTDVVVAYQQPEQPLSQAALDLLTGPVPVVAPLFSPRTAILFAEQVKSAANLHVVAMSAAVVEALGGITPKSVQTAAIPTGTEMRRCVEHLLSGATLP